MTVAIGLVCKDGVIVASDSMGSDQMTATIATKVWTFSRSPVIWTASGSQYVIEEVTAAFEKLDAEGSDSTPLRAFTDPNLPALRGKLNSAAIGAMRKAYANALASTPFPQGAIPNSFASNFLVLGFSNEQPWFLEINNDGQLNWHTEGGFYATGSGGQFATVARGLMSHYLGEELTLEQGKLVAFRAIATTIEVSSSGVGPPVQIAVCDANGPRVLGQEEMDSIKVSVDRWKELESQSIRDANGSGEAVGDIPSLEEQGAP
jgi:20S proteasome alpha/beta subunit